MDKTTAILGTLGLCVLAGCVTVLAWHGTLDGQAVIGFFSGLSLSAIVGGVGHAAAKNGARAALGEMNGAAATPVPSPPRRRTRATTPAP